jgi:hypothetical protein
MTCLSTRINGSPKPLPIDLPNWLRFSRSWMRSTSQSARLAISHHGEMVSSGGNRSLDSQPSCMQDHYWRMNTLPSSPSTGLSMSPSRTQPSLTPTTLGPLALAGTNQPLQILFRWATPAPSPQSACLPVG